MDRRLRAAIESLFMSATERAEQPDVLDEVSAGLWYLRHVMLDAVPRFLRRLHEAFESRFGPIDPVAIPMPVGFGSWMGGDRDGNPFVTVDVTARTLEWHRDVVLDRYERDLEALVDPLAATDDRLPPHDDLKAALKRAAAAVPELAAEADERNPREPLRRLVTMMAGRLKRTRDGADGAYAGPETFLNDLQVVRTLLQRAQSTALPDDELLNLIQRVRCFGFHLAALDVREDSRVHREVIGELLGTPGYGAAPAPERLLALGALALPQPGREDLSPAAVRLLALFASIRTLHERFGVQTLGTYIISMTESVADVIEVLRFAELHGISDHLDIVPLLETPEDLARAGTLLEALFEHPGYAAHLDRRGRRQELLVGYSDSMKRGGMLASRVGVADAQRAAADVCRRRNVRLRVFHGRGGSVSRGGGPTHRAILALPPQAFSGEIRITEQGEMRAHNFANPDLAVRYLEQSVGAATQMRCAGLSAEPLLPEEKATLTRLASASQRAYAALLDDPRLVPYFAAATPFEHIAHLNIGSRPTRRTGTQVGIETMRAIPWVFSWSQSRHVLTGWFGVGSALAESLQSPEGEARLRDVYGSSRFLRDLIDNVEMALAKTDLPIASRYADLCETSDRALFEVIAAEFERTVTAVLRLTHRTDLLAEDSVLARSIRLRNPYVDPLSYLQVEAMRRLRGDAGLAAPERATWSLVARTTVQGIAAGIRHTG